MGKKKLQENTFFILITLIRDFFVSLAQSLSLFIRNLIGKEQKPLQENKFLDIMNFFFHIGPKSFWHAPSGIKIGRSIGTFLHYIFKKEQYFSPKKK
ncbi:MAG: hypothetical protein WC774_00160 [Candidatus Gracilibacteria bacterium]